MRIQGSGAGQEAVPSVESYAQCWWGASVPPRRRGPGAGATPIRVGLHLATAGAVPIAVALLLARAAIASMRTGG
jgi:hypothetical protein